MGRVRRGWVAGLVVLFGALALVACSGGGGSSDHAARPGRVVFDAVGTTGTQQDLERAAAIVEQRLHKLGVDDASVAVKGRTLVATDTGIAAPAAGVTATGLLEFRPVVAILPPGDAQPSPDGVPADAEVLPLRGNAAQIRYAVGPSVMSGADFSGAKAEFIGGQQGWVVVLSLKPSGERAFNQLAGRLYSQPAPQNSVAIVLDGVVQSAPAFMESSFAGDVQISGDFTRAQAEALAVALQYGALPVHLQVRPGTGS